MWNKKENVIGKISAEKVFSFKIEQANWKVSTIMKKAQGYINLCRIGYREKMNGLILFGCIAAGFFKHSKYISWSQKERTNQRFLNKKSRTTWENYVTSCLINIRYGAFFSSSKGGH